jgi:cell division protein FtsN
MAHVSKSGQKISTKIREARSMYCTKCEFEIKGEGRKECPICGGPLIDFSSLASETPEDQSAENSQETSSESTFDLASLLNDDDKVSEKGHEPEEPPVEELSSENVEPPSFEKTGGSQDTSTSESKESIPFDLESALINEEQKHSPEPETEQEKEDLFTFETALNQDEEKHSPESEEPAQVSPASEHKPESEAEPEPPLEELSTEELLRRIAEEYKLDVEKESAAAAPPPPSRDPRPVPARSSRDPRPAPARSSRSIFPIAALAVFALMAAIASIAYLAPQDKLHPTIVNLKTETEKKIDAFTDLVIINVEKYLYQQEEPSSSVPQQKTGTHKPLNKTRLGKEPPAQEKTAPVETKSAVVNKIVPEESQKTAQKEPAQPQAETAKEIIPLQEKPSPQLVEKKEKTPVKTTGTKSSRGSLYSLHTGSFAKESIASGESERLTRMGFNSYLQKVSLENGQTWYRIKVGDFNSRKEAKEIQDKLKKKAPHVKAYVMKKRVPAEAPVAAEISKDSKPVAITDPAVSIETLPGITAEPKDQTSAAMEEFPETEIQEGQEEITPIE